MDGLAPAIAIKQKNQTRNPRSTVATATEIYDYLRLLYARCGTVTCLALRRHRQTRHRRRNRHRPPRPARRHPHLRPLPHRPRRSKTRAHAARPSRSKESPSHPSPQRSRTKKSAEEPRPPLAFDLTDALKDRLTELRRRGYNRLYQTGNIVEFSTPESLLELDFAQPIFVLIDRLAISPDIRTRIVDAIETGYRESGEVQFHTVPREDAKQPAAPPLLRRLRVHHLPPRLPRARAAPLLLQQSLRRLPPLPGLRQHHRLRPQPHHPRPLEDPRRRRHRPLDHHQIPPPPRRDDPRRQSRRHPHRRPLVRPHRPTSSASSKTAAAPSPASAASSPRSSARSTSSTSASSSPSTAATPSAPTAAASASAPKPAPSYRSTTKTSARLSALTITAAQDFFDNLQLSPCTNGNRRQDPRRGPPAHPLPPPGRPRLPHPRPPQLHPLRRRIPAHPARHISRLAPRRRSLRPRRTHPSASTPATPPSSSAS